MFTALFGVSRRWEMIFLLCSGIVIVYTLRVNISVAAPKMMDELGWSETQKGFVLSAFYWGYAAGQIPASRFAQIYGAKWMFGLSVLIPAILSMIVPVACRDSYPLALFIRCILGLCESASFPAVFHFFPLWIPAEEKTMMITTTMSGMYVGEIIGFSLSGILVESKLMYNGTDFGGWPSVFYLFGLCGILWFPLWAYFAYESPTTHPYITTDEVNYIQRSKGYQSLMTRENSKTGVTANPLNYEYMEHGDGNNNQVISSINTVTLNEEPAHRGPANAASLIGPADSVDHLKSADLARRTPWIKFFMYKESLVLFAASWVFGFIGFMLLSEMPSYLTEQLNFDIASAGALCVVPYASLFLTSLLFGKLFDHMQQHHNWSSRTVRQVAQYVAFGGSGGFLLLCGFSTQVYASYAFMVIGQALLGVCQSGIACAYLDLAPRFSSQMNTVGNTIGAIAGIVGPIVVAYFIEGLGADWGWKAVFLLTAGMCVVSLALWSAFQSSDIHPVLNTPLPKRI